MSEVFAYAKLQSKTSSTIYTCWLNLSSQDKTNLRSDHEFADGSTYKSALASLHLSLVGCFGSILNYV